MKEEIRNVLSDDNEVKYGTSILNDIAQQKVYPDDEKAWEDSEISSDELSKMRDELMQDGTDEVTVDHKVDLNTGISSEEIIDDDERRFQEILEENKNRPRAINEKGIKYLDDVMNHTGNKDIIDSIENYFKSIEHQVDIDMDNIDNIKTYLNDGFVSTFENMCNTNNASLEQTLKRFLNEMYKYYDFTDKARDDVDDLTDIARYFTKLNGAAAELKELKEHKGEEGYEDNLLNIEKKFDILLKNSQFLNERQNRLRNEYTVDDIDVMSIESAKKCLSDAISFKKFYDKLNNPDAINSYKRSLKNNKDVYGTIESWISEIRSDPNTLFTFPVSDEIPVTEAKFKLVEYFRNFMLLYGLSEDVINSIPSDTSEVEKYLLDNNHITEDDAKQANDVSWAFTFMLCKVFKYKNIRSVDDRRILSYTLDILSKLMVKDYREPVYKLMMDISNIVNNG